MLRNLREGCSVAFQIPYCMLDTEWMSLKQNAVRKEIKTKSAGHPTIITVEEEQVLAARLKDFAGWVFRCTPQQIRRAAFVFANMKDINHPWGKEKYLQAKNGSHVSWKEMTLHWESQKVLSGERAQVTNQNVVADFLICIEICVGNQRPWHATLYFQYRRDSVSS